MVKYIGVDDRKVDLFEGQFIVPEGISYNSYLILDEKVAIMDSVDINFKDVSGEVAYTLSNDNVELTDSQKEE